MERESVAVICQQSVNERGWGGGALASRGMSALEKRREELESGFDGDHDLPYSFRLPLSVPHVLAWMSLLVKVQQGEVYACCRAREQQHKLNVSKEMLRKQRIELGSLLITDCKRFFTRRSSQNATFTSRSASCCRYGSSDDCLRDLSNLQSQMASTSRKTDQCHGDLDPP